jgi:hypothetical protein
MMSWYDEYLDEFEAIVKPKQPEPKTEMVNCDWCDTLFSPLIGEVYCSKGCYERANHPELFALG